MIQVLNNNKDKTFYTICKTCNSELSYRYEDVTFKEIPYSFGSIGSIVCPVCNKLTLAELKTKDRYSDNSFALNSSTLPMLNNCCCEGDKDA